MIVVESKFYPYVLMSIRGDSNSEAEVRGMLESTMVIGRNALRAGTRHVCVTLGGTSMTPGERRMMASMMVDFPQELLALILGSFVVVENPIMRGALTALRWLSPKLVMIEPVPSVVAAMDAGDAALRKNGIAVKKERRQSAQRWLEAEEEARRAAARVSPHTV
jgi:hypothetical protein